MSLGRYRRDLDSIMQSLLRNLLSALLGGYNPYGDREQMIEDLVPELTGYVRIARNEAHRVAVRQLAEEAPDGRTPCIPDQRGYAQDAVKKVLEDNLNGSPSAAANKIAPALVRHAEQAARDTITDAALDFNWRDEPDEDERERDREWLNSLEDGDEDDEFRRLLEQNDRDRERERGRPRSQRDRDRGAPRRGSRLQINFGDAFDEDEELQRELDKAMRQQDRPVRPIGWARIMTGAETCAFCTMLASRPGAGERRFYTSADAAGGEMAQAKYQGTALFVNRYHTNCDCIVVPVYDEDNWSGKDQAEFLYKNVYLEALGGKPAVGWRSNKYSENDVVKTLEKWLKTHEFELPALREMI